jgi:hypothetical protein
VSLASLPAKSSWSVSHANSIGGYIASWHLYPRAPYRILLHTRRDDWLPRYSGTPRSVPLPRPSLHGPALPAFLRLVLETAPILVLTPASMIFAAIIILNLIILEAIAITLLLCQVL